MKVIDLLNKMAHGEEVPEKIKVDNIIYIYENWEHFYYTDNEAREDLLVRGKDYSTLDFLNWNVELKEEDIIDNIRLFKTDGCEDMAQRDLREYINKIIVPSLKQLNRELKELKNK